MLWLLWLWSERSVGCRALVFRALVCVGVGSVRWFALVLVLVPCVALRCVGCRVLVLVLCVGLRWCWFHALVLVLVSVFVVCFCSDKLREFQTETRGRCGGCFASGSVAGLLVVVAGGWCGG